MRRILITTCSLLITSVIFLLTSCLPHHPAPPPSQTSLVIYRFEQPALVGYSDGLQITQEIPFSYPVSCGLYDIFPAPPGSVMAIELSCPNGQSVLFMDTSAFASTGSAERLSTSLETGTISLPFSSTDSHFLAWQSDGLAAYVKADSLNNPQIVRAYVSGAKEILPISEYTYDLAAKPDSQDFTFTLSRGLGYGSELHIMQYATRNTKLLYADQYNYISFARFSPNGEQITFIKIPDTQTPFTVGELWVMDADGSNARKLADADAGHGYAANWSPDGTKIAFVVRENPGDENANHSSEALISNIHIVGVASGELTQITNFTEGHAETPHWSPDGNTLAFNAVINGRMQVHIADIGSMEVGSPNPFSVEIKLLVTESACCPAWMRK